MKFLSGLFACAAVMCFIGGCASPSSSSSSETNRWVDQSARSPLKPAGVAYMDLNKNGKRDSYENPDLAIERRIDDLLKQMTVEEKTCQLATLYGFRRQLKDDLPKPSWKQEIWKDGLANIDEH